MAGSITRWPATRKNIQKRVVTLFKLIHNENDKLNLDTIPRHTDGDNDYVTFEYTFEKQLDLYHYVDIIVNDKSVMDYTSLFGKMTEPLNMFYVCKYADQFVLDGILNYINPPELTDYTNTNNLNCHDDYDYKGLNELYKETLSSFSFKLRPTKGIEDEEKTIYGVVFQKKK